MEDEQKKHNETDNNSENKEKKLIMDIYLGRLYLVFF